MYLSDVTFLIAYCTNEHLMAKASILGIMQELGRGKLQRTVTYIIPMGRTYCSSKGELLKSYRIIELADL